MHLFRLEYPSPRSKGFSLIEIGVVLLVVSLALVPIIQMIGGPNSQSGQGSAQRLNSLRSKEMTLANSLIERALSSDFNAFNCNAAFNPATGLPASGQTATLPATARCTDNTYNTPLYYQWTLKNADTSGSIVPLGNHYYQVVLSIWNQPTGGTPLLTLPTTLFWNETGATTASNKTGIVIVQDISGSMSWGQVDGTPAIPSENTFGQASNNRASSPYLKYRYKDPSYPAYTPNDISLTLNINDNNQLDIVSLLDSNDPGTPWNDGYIGPGSTGVPKKNAGRPFDCTDDPAAANSSWWADTRLPWDLQGNNTYRDHVKALCQATLYPKNSATRQNLLNGNLSRIEAARSSLLNFLLSMEDDPELYQNTGLGFVTFESGVKSRVPIETADSTNRFPKMRRALSWMNRNGPGIISPAGATNMYGGLTRGADMIFADKTLDNRIIFLVGDGAPTVGPTAHSSFKNLADQIGGGTYPGANCNRASIFTLGLLSKEVQLPVYLRDDLANRTPGGQFFFAQNIGDVDPIFHQIKYQIQRLMLLNKSNRYNIELIASSTSSKCSTGPTPTPPAPKPPAPKPPAPKPPAPKPPAPKPPPKPPAPKPPPAPVS